MFGFSSYTRYMQEKQRVASLPHREVTEKEFIRLAVMAGKTRKEAASTARMCKILGSHTRIGKEMLGISK